jgi:hypothetical protein
VYIANAMIKNYQTELKWGILFSLMTLFWMFMERMLGWHEELISKHAIFTNFIAIPAIALYVAALLEKRNKDYEGVMTYKQGLFSGIVISVVVMALSPLVQIITSLVITPHYFANAIKYAVASGAMKQEAAESYFTLSNYIILGLFGAPMMGFLTSAIVALFVRKKAA